MVTLPFVASDNNEYVKLSPSTSLADNWIVIETPSLVSPDKSVDATGASFTAAMVTVNTCESVKSPSVTLTVKFSVPLKSAGAEKLKSEPSKVATISVPVVTLYVRSSPSISDADKVTPPELSSSKDTLSNVASTGVSLTEFIWIFTIDKSDESSESEAINEKLSDPL